MILATALGNLTPVVSAILGGALGTERLGTVKLAGVLLAIAGSLAMVHPSAGELPAARRPFLLGCALLAASPASWAASLFVAKPLLARYPPIVLTAWNFSLGTAVMACAAAGLQGGGDPAIWRVASWREGLALALAATFGCAFKFSAVSWLLFNTEATLLCVFETAGHVGTILATAFVLHEPLLRRYAFAVPVFLGCALVAAAGDWGPPPPPPRAAQQQPDEASALPPGSAAAEEGGLPAGGQDDLRTPLLANGASE